MRSLIVSSAILTAATTASANPRALPFTYTTDTLAPGQAELEQFVDLIPLRARASSNQEQHYLASQFQTELEIGIAERLELGLYFTFVPTISPATFPGGTAELPEGNGIKQRLRYTFADPGAWPIDLGVYGEVSENEREVELEGKILLQRRFDRLRIAANLWAEYELYFDHQRDVVLNPTLGATYEVSPKIHLGIDSWMRGEYPRNPAPATRTFGLGPEAYVGPAVMFNFGRVWWSFAAYARVTDTAHSAQGNEAYGAMWFRSMVGYNL